MSDGIAFVAGSSFLFLQRSGEYSQMPDGTGGTCDEESLDLWDKVRWEDITPWKDRDGWKRTSTRRLRPSPFGVFTTRSAAPWLSVCIASTGMPIPTSALCTESARDWPRVWLSASFPTASAWPITRMLDAGYCRSSVNMCCAVLDNSA